ncbi:MAG TPA: tRNA (guanosine(18)-2'-O)-methyltransferase TrmH, partial [Gammaproteobacteria bacterium]|nr:tRNA (guanosine(18)-2'-O)-methyltransferase TrmH [Gammaproteobacteria bacterium]
MTPQRYQKIRDTLNRRQPDLTVLAENVHKPHNISAILRTCDAVGIAKAHVVMPDDPGFRMRSGIAMGSDRWVEHQLYTDINLPIERLKASGHRVLAAHFSDHAVDFRDIDYTQPTALLLGTEKFGVSETAVAACDAHVVIPMMGMVASFNVSVAAAIILSEAQRQRAKAGMYSDVRLPQAEYQRLLFRWCQPIVAQFCDERDLAY